MEEDKCTVADAVVVGNLLISLLRNTDRVHSASQAQLVNALAPITTEPGGPVWKQATFHPFALSSKYAAGQVLQVAIDSPRHENKRFGQSNILESAVTFDEASGDLVVFAVNRSIDQSTELSLDLKAFGDVKVVEAVTLSNEDHHWRATMEDSTSVGPLPYESVKLADALLTATLPDIFWSRIRLSASK